MISEVQSRIQRVNCRVKSENRLPSLDVFRGLAIICMLLVNSLMLYMKMENNYLFQEDLVMHSWYCLIKQNSYIK